MKAILDKDIIVNFHRDGDVDVVVPKGVALERLRVVFDEEGWCLIDLIDLEEIHVELKNGKFILHAQGYENTQQVVMAWSDRRNLVNDGGTYRVKTEQEIDDEHTERINERVDNKHLRREMKNLIDNLKFGQIDTHIDNVFGNLNTSQKNSLKKLYKAVLYLAKKR